MSVNQAMTPEQLKAEVEKLVAENGYEIKVSIVDAGGLDITEALVRQRGYMPIVQVVQVVNKTEVKASV